MNLERKLNFDKLQNLSFFPLLIGMAFAFGWSPCIGPILGSVLAIAINDSVNGTLLLTIYSIGLGVPFLIVGLMMGRLIILSKKFGKIFKIFSDFDRFNFIGNWYLNIKWDYPVTWLPA